MPVRRIPENILIDAIDAITADYRERHGREPINVSHWDPSEEFTRKLRDLSPVEPFVDPVPYRYSYMLAEEREQIVRKLGFDSDVSTLLTENGSMSMIAASHWLSAKGVTTVRLMMPAYFVTTYSLSCFGIQVNEMHLDRTDGRYNWPKGLKLADREALWITNPVYNTGCYSLEPHAEYLREIASSGTTVVLDEALAITPTSFSKSCSGLREFLAIYTPHKAACLNSFKFSTLVFHRDYEDFFDDWADVFFGGLSRSAVAATRHFVSKDYDTYLGKFVEMLEETRLWHSALLRSFGGRVETDRDTKGHFLSVYFPEIDGALGSSLEFLRETIDAAGAAFIPGQRSGFPSKHGLCFRVNLALDSPQFRGALGRLYRQLLTV